MSPNGSDYSGFKYNEFKVIKNFIHFKYTLVYLISHHLLRNYYWTQVRNGLIMKRGMYYYKDSDEV